MSNSNENQPAAIKLGLVGWLRWGWRQLTTMRVALWLLLLLGLAAIPGSIFPQRPQSQSKVKDYLAQNPEWGQWIDRLGGFDVYGSVWFSAIYLLLMISLIGCIIPRVGVHWRKRKTPPLSAPRNLQTADIWTSADVSSVANFDPQMVFQHLQSRRWKTAISATDAKVEIAAEKGTWRETGNLVFHISLLGILISVAIGSLYGYRGQIIVREETSFSNVLAQYDSFSAGRLFSPEQLIPFEVTLDQLDVVFETQGSQTGAARDYTAHVTISEFKNSDGECNLADANSDCTKEVLVGVNNPLNIGGASAFLVGHGYAPHFKVEDADGNVVFDDSVVFLPQDRNFSSKGVVKIPDMTPQLGLDGIFAPTGIVEPMVGPHSVYPDLIDPKVYMSAWVGDLGMDDGIAQNVYLLDKTNLENIGIEELAPGESWDLPNGKGKVTLVSVERFATFNIAADPGQNWALGFAILAILGITFGLYVQRRNLWVEISGAKLTIASTGRGAKQDVAQVSEFLAKLYPELALVPNSAAATDEESHG